MRCWVGRTSDKIRGVKGGGEKGREGGICEIGEEDDEHEITRYDNRPVPLYQSAIVHVKVNKIMHDLLDVMSERKGLGTNFEGYHVQPTLSSHVEGQKAHTR